MASRSMTVSGPIATGARRSDVILLAREVQARFSLDPFSHEPEEDLARVLGSTPHDGGLRLFGASVRLVSRGADGAPEFRPMRSIMVSHAVTRRDLATLVGHQVLHAPEVERAHGPGAVLVVGEGFEPDPADGVDLAEREALWFAMALTLPREAVEASVARHGLEGAARSCRMPRSTFDAAVRIYGIEPVAA